MKKAKFRPLSGHDNNSALLTYVRIGIVALAVLVQLALMLLFTTWLRTYAALLYMLLDILAIVTVFSLINRHDSSTYRIAWIILVLITPIFGMFLYWAWGRVDFNRKERGALKKAFDEGFAHMRPDSPVRAAFVEKNPAQARYVNALAGSGFEVFDQTAARYFPIGEEYFEHLIVDLENAQKFIFMEYFIIARGELWDRIHAILQRKKEQGVEIRILFDDVGCFFKVPANFDKQLRAEGFTVAVFNPAHRFVSNFYLNYRNHQKIVLIDGNIAYTGGVNLADEYVNIDSKLGHWKDVGIRLEGLAVNGLAVIFFQMWNVATRNQYADYAQYLCARPEPGEGLYQPYADGPYNNPKNPALDLIRQAAGGAQHYLWLTSPYLVIDQELSSALSLAARGGVDVRIVTPAHPDHWYVGIVNRHNYRHLLKNGVRVYEYTPGFIHAKLLVLDDRCATVGTVNLDFRSLYLHYENGVLICDAPAVLDVKHDIEQTIAVSREITLEDVRNRPWYQKLLAALFNLFSPLM